MKTDWPDHRYNKKNQNTRTENSEHY